MRKGLTVTIAGLFMLSACNGIDEKKVFNYPVTRLPMPEVTGELSPVPVYDLDYPSSSFHMLGDSVIFAYTHHLPNDPLYSFISTETADTLVQVCRKGRGPGEMLVPAAYFDVVDNVAHVVDMMQPKYYKLHLGESLSQSTTVMESVLDLDTDDIAKWSVSQCRVVSPDRLVCLNSQVNMNDFNLNGSPFFSIYDLNDGHHVEDIHCFGDIPLTQKSSMKAHVQTALGLHSTANPETGMLCFLNVRLPQINFLDCSSGTVRGVRFGREMSLSLDKPYSCFTAACSDNDRIYALFSGVETSEFSHADSKLFVFDWEGNIKGIFQLDGPYFTCDVTDKNLYLARADAEYKLYRLPLSDVR